MRIRLSLLCVLVATVVLTTSVAWAAGTNLLTNGDFETPSYTEGGFTTYEAPLDIPGWRVDSGSIDHIHGYWNPASGSQSVDMGGLVDGTIYQDITTSANQNYILSFAVAGNPDGPPAVKEMDVFWGGNLVDHVTFDMTKQSTWTYNTYELLGPGGSTRLMFRNVTSSINDPQSYGMALDNVSLTAVPEASSVFLAISGLGSISGLMRMRRRNI